MTTAPTLPADAVSTDRPKVDQAVEQILAPQPRQILEIDIRRIHPSPDNPPGRLTDDVDEIADSIREVGILEPLIVASAGAWQAADDRMPFLADDDYVALAGHRRLGGARKVAGDGPYLAPCILRDDLVGADADVAMAVENTQRKDLTAIEEARIFQRLADHHGKSQREIAKLVGKNQSHVSKRLALLDLPAKLHARVGTPDLTVEDAVDIAKAVAAAGDEKVADAILKRPTYETVERAARRIADEKRKQAAIAKAKAKLKAQGITKVINYPAHGFGYNTKALPLDQIDGLDADEHIHEACHGVAVGFKTYSSDTKLQIVPVCMNPKLHPGSPEAQRSKQQQSRERKQQRDRAMRAERSAGRVEVIKGATRKPNAELDQLAQLLLLHRLIEESFDDDDLRRLAGAIELDVELPEAPDDDDYYTQLHYKRDAERVLAEAIFAHVASSTTALRRTYLAASLLQIEEQIEHVGRPSTAAAAFIEWLQRNGHKLANQEREALKKAKGTD